MGARDMGDPDRHRFVAQLDGTPRRRYYTGRDLQRAVAVEDLRAIAHRRLPRFVLEYLEGGAGEEATLLRERTAYADWRFTPRQLVDVSRRSLQRRSRAGSRRRYHESARPRPRRGTGATGGSDWGRWPCSLLWRSACGGGPVRGSRRWIQTS